MLDVEFLLQRKRAEAMMAAQQERPQMPRAKLTIPRSNVVNNFFDDRIYDDDGQRSNEFKIRNMSDVVNTIRSEQPDEFMHHDDNFKTFNIVNETNNPHPYDAFFQRKRNESSDRTP